MNEQRPNLRRNPEANANFFTRHTFLFMLPFFIRGYRKQLEEDDMFQPLSVHESRNATKKLSDEWENEKAAATKEGRKPFLSRAVRRIYGYQILKLGIIIFIEEAIKFVQPIAMGVLIRYFRYDSPLTRTNAYLAATCFTLAGAATALLHHPYFYSLQKIGMELKIAACGMIMEKALRLSSGALHKTTIGHIVTLMSTDVLKFDLCFIFFHYIWIAPVMLFAYIGQLWYQIGVSSLAGFLALIILIPIQGFFSKKMGGCRREIAKRTDKRISIMNEILNGIRVIKMYVWEDAFVKILAGYRKAELMKVKENCVWQSLVMGTFWASGRLVILFAVLCYIFLGNSLTAEKIFVSAALYNACRLPVTLFLPFSLQFLFEARVSLRRIQAFLELEEFDMMKSLPTFQFSRSSLKSNLTNLVTEKSEHDEKVPLTLAESVDSHENMMHTGEEQMNMTHEVCVEMREFSAVWDTTKIDGENEGSTAVSDITVNMVSGQLTAIIGPVGCGKSSLLHSILRETRKTSGHLKVKGTVAFASQDAWIFSGTIRENILFGLPFDKKKYADTIRVCALKKDFSQLPYGDRSYVGDRGQSLSGGQKARISLARAVYRDADIYLLDDPLSAVDAAVGRYLFEKCVAEHLKKKLVVLVTHQVQYLEAADNVLLMRAGSVVASGKLADIKRMKIDTFTKILQETALSYHTDSLKKSARSPRFVKMGSHSERSNETENLGGYMESGSLTCEDDEPLTLRSRASSVRTSSLTKSLSESLHSLSKDVSENNGDGEYNEEDRAVGAVSWRIYYYYIKAMGESLCALLFMVIFAVTVQLFGNLIDWWLNKWTNAAERQRELSLSHASSVPLMQESLSPSNSSMVSPHTEYYDWYYIGPFSFMVGLTAYRHTFTSMVLLLMVGSVLRCIWFRLSQVVASRRLHDAMFNAVVRARLSFFDKNPVGRWPC
ncbi:hypothetical protein AB6A40_003653 [Gnathostoma spinigerum]|uniref:Uncharacterized protein n=1 Tax=Gnathostoma spinigerum TaxID=75299 RepID=A0ABD6EFQ6_9BILA